jgi:AcrR family transcriptional regulator
MASGRGERLPYRETDAARQRAQNKRDAFVCAARDLVATHGFASAKVRAIATACGTSTGSLYSYFDSHEELMAEVFRQASNCELAVVRDAVAQAPATPVDRLNTFMQTFIGRALRARQLAWSLLFEPSSPLIEAERLVYRRAYVEMGEGIIRDGIAQELFVAQDPTLASAAVIGAISETLVGRLNPVGFATVSRMSHEAVIDEVRAFCFRALQREAAINQQSVGGES